MTCVHRPWHKKIRGGGWSVTPTTSITEKTTLGLHIASRVMEHLSLRIASLWYLEHREHMIGKVKTDSNMYPTCQVFTSNDMNSPLFLFVFDKYMPNKTLMRVFSCQILHDIMIETKLIINFLLLIMWFIRNRTHGGYRRLSLSNDWPTGDWRYWPIWWDSHSPPGEQLPGSFWVLLLFFCPELRKEEVSHEVLRFCLSGFSTDTGLALIGKGELIIVSGAPRGGYSGQVAFLKPDPKASRNLSVEFVLSGPGLASSFGYDVAVVDLNGDGWVYFGTVCYDIIFNLSTKTIFLVEPLRPFRMLTM